MVAVPSSQKRLLADFPAFFRVSEELVVIVGGGEEALNKARLVAQTSARLRIVANKIEPALAAFATSHGAEQITQAFAPEHLDGARLVFVATGDEALDSAVAASAKAQKIPVNVVDRPALCDFLTPAIVNRAPVAIAIGTEGAAPVLAQMVRARIDAAFRRVWASLRILPKAGVLGSSAWCPGAGAPQFLARFLFGTGLPRR